jgi:hypothetical protein
LEFTASIINPAEHTALSYREMVKTDGLYALNDQAIYVIVIPFVLRYEYPEMSIWKIGEEPDWFDVLGPHKYKPLPKGTKFSLTFST